MVVFTHSSYIYAQEEVSDDTVATQDASPDLVNDQITDAVTQENPEEGADILDDINEPVVVTGELPDTEEAVQDDALPEEELDETLEEELEALPDQISITEEGIADTADELEPVAQIDTTADADISESVSEDEAAEIENSAAPLSEKVEDLKKAAMELNRDLIILEEELLFPASTQVVVFLSMDVGEFFKLDSVKVSINDKVVASHLYTKRQNHALFKGGIQRLYMGNLKNGEHEVTAIFTGMGPDNREYKRGATTIVDKEDDTKMIELMIRDSTKNMQPEFEFKEWEL